MTIYIKYIYHKNIKRLIFKNDGKRKGKTIRIR